MNFPSGANLAVPGHRPISDNRRRIEVDEHARRLFAQGAIHGVRDRAGPEAGLGQVNHGQRVER